MSSEERKKNCTRFKYKYITFNTAHIFLTFVYHTGIIVLMLYFQMFVFLPKMLNLHAL